mmetsp:Transcript_131118/g.231707  ORF Transcript_131118/g.231707 Transcript_131118/m.231707 type:complete len:229 (+) Transcript_131118:57-743(+)
MALARVDLRARSAILASGRTASLVSPNGAKEDVDDEASDLPNALMDERRSKLQTDMLPHMWGLSFEEVGEIANYCVQQQMQIESFGFVDPEQFAYISELSFGQRGALIKYTRIKHVQLAKDQRQRSWDDDFSVQSSRLRQVETVLETSYEYGRLLEREQQSRKLEDMAKEDYFQIPVKMRLAVAEMLSESRNTLWHRMNWPQRLALVRKCMPAVEAQERKAVMSDAFA